MEQSVKQNIITAHRVPAILVEYNYGGGFNNRAEEMSVAYKQFQQTSIKAYQNSVIRVFKSIVKWMGYENEDVQIIPFTIDEPVASQAQGGTSLEN